MRTLLKRLVVRVVGNKSDRDEEWADDGVAMTIDSATLSPPSDAQNAIIASKSVVFRKRFEIDGFLASLYFLLWY